MRLFSLRQGPRSVSEYAIEFRTLAADSGWNEASLQAVFVNGLSELLKDELVSHPVLKDFDELISLTIRIDNRCRERRREKRRNVGCDVTPRRREHSPEGSLARGSILASRATVPLSSRPRTQLHATICWRDQTLELLALIDSGADKSFLDTTLVKQLGLPTELLEEPLEASTLDGRLLARVTTRTCPVQLQLSGNHFESIPFFVIDSPFIPLVLGHSWLTTHNPNIDWTTAKISNWSPACHAKCLRSALPPSVTHQEPEPVLPDLSQIPTEYHGIPEVFCKQQALSLPPHRPYDCAIDLLPGSTFPCSSLYNISRPERAAMEEYINNSLAAGIIRPSSSPLGAGFFFVEKKDGTLRPCIDFRGLNDITVKNKYPLPLMNSAFEALQTVFTKLDLRNVYHLVRVREGDEWKTAFNTPLGHFEYLVMPFGLTNTPAVFQCLVNDVLRDMLGRFVFVYLDDIQIFSQNQAEHVQHVHKVLQRLLENRLFVKAEKCEFHASTVTFLGHMISEGQVRMDPEKVRAVLDWPKPESRKQLQRFLGFANFYRLFIRNYSRIAAPLTALTSPARPFHWNSETDGAFTELKKRFTSAPILTQPDSSRQFVVEVDASDVGVGAVLSQLSPEDNKLHPCAFLSHRLSPTERNYDVGNRELLAVKLALEEWRHWLEGADQPIVVWTDHKNLEYIRTAKRLNTRQARWDLIFGRFNFALTYRPGSRNVKPDALSRLFEREETTAGPDTIVPRTCIIGAATWEIEKDVRTALQHQPDPGNGPPGRLFVPLSVRPSVLQWGHSSRLSCHPGVARSDVPTQAVLVARHEERCSNLCFGLSRMRSE